MKKKGTAFCVLLSMTLLTIGCHSNQKTESSTAPSSTPNRIASLETVLKEYQSSTATTNYKVEIKNYEKTETHNLNYPQISGWSQKDQMKQWNSQFKKDIEDAASCYSDKDGCEINYEVTMQTDKILSILGTGYMSYADAAHPYGTIYTYNIDMETGKSLTLSDMANPEKIADTLLNTKNYSILSNSSEITLEDILKYNFSDQLPTQEKLSSSLSHFDGEISEYLEGECFGNSYMKDGKICLIFGVNHALGDFVTVQIEK